MSGYLKTLRDFLPRFIYTFDPEFSSLNLAAQTGFFLDYSENSFRPMTLEKTHLIESIKSVNFTTPALSLIENASYYKSFESGTPDVYTSPTGYKINQSSFCAELSLKHSNKPKNNYSLLLQLYIKLPQPPYTTKTYPRLISTEDNVIGLPRKTHAGYGWGFKSSIFSGIESHIEYGFQAHCLFSDQMDSMDNTPSTKPSMYGWELKSKLETRPAIQLPIIPDYFPTVMFEENSPLSLSKYSNNNVLEFDNIILKVLPNVSTNQFQLRMIDKDGINKTSMLLEVDTFYNLCINVNIPSSSSDFHNVEVFCNDNLVISCKVAARVIDDNEDYNFTARVGYKTSWVDVVETTQVKIAKDEEKLVFLDSPRFIARFDNFGLYTEFFDESKLTDLTNLNLDLLTRYRNYGFKFLYNWEKHYNKLIYDGMMLSDAFNEAYQLDNIHINPNRKHNTDKINSVLIAVGDDIKVNYINGNYAAYSLSTTKNSHLVSPLNPSTYSNSNRYHSCLRSATGVISFGFRTLDTNGMLFTNSYYQTTIGVAILFRNSSFEIYFNNQLKISLNNNLCDGRFHRITVNFSTTSTTVYLENDVVATTNGNLHRTDMRTTFGNVITGNNPLEAEYINIAISDKTLPLAAIENFNKLETLYSANGLVTLNNIAKDAILRIYNDYTGELIELLQNSSLDGTFTYYNNRPHPIYIEVADDSGTTGVISIVAPIYLK